MITSDFTSTILPLDQCSLNALGPNEIVPPTLKKKLHKVFLLLKAFQIWEKACDTAKLLGKIGFHVYPDFEGP